MSATLRLATDLIARRSVTPEDAGCLELIGERLARCGFALERMDAGGVSNLWARLGDTEPLFVFAGHTDVVPAGPENEWRFPPFEPAVHDGFLYGRGAADMKGGLAAMVTATETFLADSPSMKGSIAFLITSDEEGPAEFGTRHVVRALEARGEKIRWCVVGEPSSREALGDVIRVGRRGSLSGTLLVRGIQGHVAYPELALNPVHAALPALHELASRRWDDGYETFPPTSFQVSNIHAGTGASNVIPGTLEVHFNLRYSPALDVACIQETVKAILERHGLNWHIDWHDSGRPFYTPPGALRSAVSGAIAAIMGRMPEESTGGGTSDGRFIAPTGAEVVELGPNNATIHKLNERVPVEELDRLSEIYRVILEKLLCS